MCHVHVCSRLIGHIGFELRIAKPLLEFLPNGLRVREIVLLGLEVARVAKKVPEAQKGEMR
jgi:hypothetical protein